MKEIMDKILPLIKEIENIEINKKEIKKQISDLLEILVNRLPKGSKKFLYQNRWYAIKNRAGKFFIVDFNDREPGSWRKKKTDPSEDK